MTNNSEDTRKSMVRPAINYSGRIALAIIILLVVFYLFNQTNSFAETFLAFAILTAGLVYSIRDFRDKHLNGFISYGNALGYSFYIGMFTGIFTGVFIYLLYGFIAPDLMETIRMNTIEMTEYQMFRLNPNISDAELDRMVNFQLFFLTPAWMMIRTIIGLIIQSILITLIAAIFLKRKYPSSLHS